MATARMAGTSILAVVCARVIEPGPGSARPWIRSQEVGEGWEDRGSGFNVPEFESQLCSEITDLGQGGYMPSMPQCLQV